MLKLSHLTQRIEALEAEEYHADDEALSTWLDILTFIFWRHPYGDEWRAPYDALPTEHQVKKACYVLGWRLYQFYDMLSGPRDGWFSERLQISIDVVVERAIGDGFSYSQLATVESMHGAFQIVNQLMNDVSIWTAFYQRKKFEHEQAEKRHLYRRMAHEGTLTPEAISWLKEFDLDFWDNLQSKKTETHSQPAPAIVLPTPIQPAPPIVEVQPAPPPVPSNDPVEVMYSGVCPEGSISINTADGRNRPVWRGRIYTITAEQWASIRADSSLSHLWQRVITKHPL